MFSMTVLTNEGTAPGFRLAGIDVVEVGTVAEARGELIELLNDQRMGIIAIDEHLSECVDPALQAKIDRLYRPVVVIIPSAMGGSGKESKRAYLERLIKNAIGFEMKLG